MRKDAEVWAKGGGVWVRERVTESPSVDMMQSYPHWVILWNSVYEPSQPAVPLDMVLGPNFVIVLLELARVLN